MPDDEAEAIFTTGKADYIEAYAQRMAPTLAAIKASWAPAEGELLIELLRAKFEPIMLQTDQICDGIGYPVELRLGAETVVLDFPKRVVREPIPDEVPLRVRHPAGAGAHGPPRRRAGLGQHDLPVDAVHGLAGGRLQRVPVHVLRA